MLNFTLLAVIHTPKRLCQLTALLVITLLIGACAGPFMAQNREAHITKSPSDKRDYLTFKLDNQLTVMVISDPEADKAAAALSVAVGSGSDPKDREGLAHFLEHMLFLGTEKYPEAGAYQQFISEHGGSHNAYTAFDETNYFFDINAASLQPALDQFAQFFIAPLFNNEYVEREKHAVHSEYQAKIRDDSRLQYEVFKTLSNPAHPFSQFSVGSLETLADRPGQTVRDDLLAFYREHYSANLMTLVVLGNESTKALRRLVNETFARITNHGTPRPKFTQPLFTTLPLQVDTEPHQNLRRLVFSFPIPSTRSLYQSKPIHYLTNLLGHEGKGSLLSYLKQQGWADSLSAGIAFESDQQANLQISIGVTETGLQQTDAIAAALFSSIQLIRQQGIEKWRYDEQAQLAALAFRFQQNSSNMHYVTQLASELHHIPANDVLSAPYQMKRFDPALINRYLAALRPDNLLLMRVAKGLTSKQHTAHFNAPYKVTPISEALQARWLPASLNSEIHLPETNPFLPEDLRLLSAACSPDCATKKPQRIQTGSNIPLWHSTDTSFMAPRADFYFTLRSPLTNKSARHTVLTALLVKTVNEQLNEFSYPALLAGLNYQLYPHVRGISVRISGYQDKQSVLLDKIIQGLTVPAIDHESFARHKDELVRSWENALKQKPYRQTMRKLSTLLAQPSWDETQLIAAIKQITTDDLRRFSQLFLRQLDIEALANGNIENAQAQKMVHLLHQQLSERQTVKVARLRIAKLPKQRLLLPFTTEHNDTAVTLYAQGENKNIATRARLALLNQILSAPFYHELRTRQQLGYIVFSSPMTLMDTPALAFTVQSPNTSANSILEAMEKFIAAFSTTIATMDIKALTTHKQALISQIMEKDAQLSQRSNRYWHEIDRSNFQFNTREQLVAAIEKINLADIKQAYRKVLIEQPRMLASVGQHANDKQEKAPAHYHLIEATERSALTEGYFED